MIHRREFEDKLKIVHYNLKTSIRLWITLQLQDIIMIGLHTTPEKRSQIWHIYSQFTPDCLKARDLSSRCCFSDVSDVAEEWNSLNNKGINFNLDGHLL